MLLGVESVSSFATQVGIETFHLKWGMITVG